MVDVPATPVLATIPRVELGSVGTWDISNIDGWHPTADDFASAVAAMDCPAVRRPALKFGHSEGPGDPSIGVIDNLAVTDDGQTLVGDYVGVPAWLAAADDEGRAVIASAYPDRSGEWEHNYVCQLGHTHPFVLHAMALLGVVRPGIGTLESLYDLYAKAPEKETAMATTALASVTVDQVRSAYYNGPAANDYNLWIREVLVDPPQLIVQNDSDNSLQRVPFTASDNEVTFGEPTKVTVEYIDAAPAAPAAAAPAVRFASRAESRPGRPAAAPTPAAGAVGATTEGGSDVEITDDQLATLRTALGLAADADLDAILAAAVAANAGEGEATEETADPAAPAEPTDTAQASTGGLPAGVVAIDSGRLQALEADAAAFKAHLAKQRSAEIDQVLSSAISEGRITPANSAAWRETLTRDLDHGRTLLASMAANSAVPVTELGHATASADVADVQASATYKNWSI